MEDATVFKCPACKSNFSLEDHVEEEDLIFCPNCDVELEVESVDPPKVIQVDTVDLEDEIDEDNFDDYDFDDEEDEF